MYPQERLQDSFSNFFSTKYIYETLFIKIPNVLHVTTTVMVPLERENTRNVIIQPIRAGFALVTRVSGMTGKRGILSAVDTKSP